VTSIEFVIPKPPNSTSICGFNETPSCSVAPASAASVDVASVALEANARIDIRKQRLGIFVSTVVTDIGDASLPSRSPLSRTPQTTAKKPPQLQLDAHIKARFEPNDKQNSRSFYSAENCSAKRGASWATRFDFTGAEAPFRLMASS